MWPSQKTQTLTFFSPVYIQTFQPTLYSPRNSEYKWIKKSESFMSQLFELSGTNISRDNIGALLLPVRIDKESNAQNS